MWRLESEDLQRIGSAEELQLAPAAGTGHSPVPDHVGRPGRG